MKIVFLLCTLLPMSSMAYENPEVFCSVNNSRLTKLSCSGQWSEMMGFPEIRVKMKECFGFKSTERLQIEIDGDSETYDSVIFPFSTRQDGYSITCTRSNR